MPLETVATPTPAAPAAGDTDIAEAQEQLRLVTAGYEHGINSRTDVDKAAVALAEARIHSAIARDQLTDLGPDLDAIVKLREQSLGRAQAKFAAGVIGASDLNNEEAALAEARVRVDLYAVMAARRAILANATLRYRTGVTSVQERDEASSSLQEAQRRFLESNKN